MDIQTSENNLENITENIKKYFLNPVPVSTVLNIDLVGCAESEKEKLLDLLFLK